MFRLVKFLALFLVAVLAVVAVFPLLPPFRDWYASRAVLTGSMEPIIPKGAVIINRWSEDKNLKINDLITYRKPDQKNFYITHRIVKIEKKGALYFFQTKGDRVLLPDPWQINQGQIEGKVIFVIPLLGYLDVFVQSPLGFLFLILLPAGWIIFEEIKNIKKELKRGKTPLLLFFLSVFFLSRILPTYAYFSSPSVSLTGINLATASQWVDNPPSSSLEILADYQKQANFNLSFSAADDFSKIQEVRLYYARDLYGSWVYFDSKFPGINPASGSFSFDSPLGDGYYRFLSVAIDESGKAEYDLNNLDFLSANTWTVVDTAAPVTNLSVNQPLAVANDQIYNGGFENGNLDGWTSTGNGDHQATQASVKSGSWSALLGGAETETLSKNISLPLDVISTLSFWYRLLTNDNVSGGFFDATVKNDSLETKIVHDGWDDPTISETDLGWKSVVSQLNNLVGQNIDLQFKVSQPNDGYKTWVYLDDVRITAATNAATVSSQISLFSHDASGSGVAGIFYQIDDGIIATYSAPLTMDSGTHALTYFAKDEAGNEEATKSVTINATSSASLDFGVVLNEFLPSGGWVEVYNNSLNAIDVSGWKIKNNAGNEFLINNSSIASHEKVRIENVEMNENGDSLVLLKSDGTKVDSFSYVSSIFGKSFKREPDGTGTWKDPEVEVKPELIASKSAEITITASPSGSVQPSPVIFPELTATPSAVPSATPTPTPTLISTPDPVSSPTPVPIITPTPPLVVEPTPSATIIPSSAETMPSLPPSTTLPSPSIVNLETQPTPSPNLDPDLPI